MSKSLISTGINPNDGNGDTLLAGATKVNSNFNEIYSALGNGTNINIGVGKTVISTNASGNVGIGTTNSSQKLTVQGNISATALFASSIVLSGVGTIPTLRGTTLNYTTGNIVTGVVTSLSGSTLNYSGIVTGGSYRVGSNEVISSARQLRNIASIDSVTKATLESSIQLAPNNFNDLNVIGISTLTGNVSFGSSAFFGDNDKVNLGDSSDLQLYHDSANSFIHEVGTGSLNIRADGTGVNIQRVNGENLARFLSDSRVELYFDNSKKFETNTSGVSITGTTQSQQLNVTGVSTFAGITTVTGTTLFAKQLNVSGVSIFNSNVSFGSSAFFGDNDKVNLGDSSDLQLYHDGSDSYIHEVGTGSLNVRADGTAVNIQKFNGENLARFLTDSSVELYFDNSKKFQTSGVGVTVFGTLDSQQLNVTGVSTFAGITTVTGTTLFAKQLNVSGVSTFAGNVSFGSSAFFGDNDKVNLGDSSDLQLYHDGSNSFIHEVGTGSLNIRADGTGVNIQRVNGENLARFLSDSRVELYFDNSKKFETNTSGSTVFGTLQTGSVGIGTTNPKAYLNIAAGTAAANTSPLKFTAGTNLSAIETGAVEYDGRSLNFTPNTDFGRASIPTTVYTSGVGSTLTSASETTNQTLFPTANDSITLQVGTYFINMDLAVTRGTSSTTSSALRIRFGGSGTAVGTFSGNAIGGLDTGAASIYHYNSVALTADNIITSNITTNGGIYSSKVSGILRVTTAGTFTPSYSLSANLSGATSATTPSALNYMIIQSLGSSGSAAATGGWA